jgi:hypothetical protein
MTVVIGSTGSGMSGLRSPCPPGLRAGRRIGDRPQVLHFPRGLPARFPDNIGAVTIRGGRPSALVVIAPTLAGRCRLAWIIGGGFEERVPYPEPDGVDNRVAEDAAAYESEGLPNRLP